jgi:hypothetical protein
MRFREINTLIESNVTLKPNDLIKHGPERLNNLISMIKTGKPLYTADGTAVVIKKSEAKRILDLYNAQQFKGSITLTGADGQMYPLGSFLKTKEFGGQSVPPGQDSNGEAPVAGIRPGQVFGHGDVGRGETLTPELAVNLGAFQAKYLGNKIATNAYLDSQGNAGAAVKSMSKEIESGSQPTIPNLSKGELSNIQNYAFEYLGVQQLIKRTADFPNADAFYNHVGSNLEDLILYFPKSSGNPLADSYALVNKATENTIGMSSKGAKGGAPSSIQGLKIPEAMRKSIGRDPAITLIDLIQKTETWKQPFAAVNWIHEKFPGNLGSLEQFLPFDDRFLGWCLETFRRPVQQVPATLDQIPRNYRKLYTLVQKSVAKRVENPLFYDVRYFVKDILHTAIRNGAVPNFNARMLELLGENFVVLKTERAGKPGVGKFITHVHWPSKVGGTVTFEHKDPAPKWMSAITWKLS